MSEQERTLHVVDDAVNGAGPAIESAQEAGASLAASADRTSTPAASQTAASAQGTASWVTPLVLEAAFSSVGGTFAGYAAAPKTRKGPGTLVGTLTGFGVWSLIRGALRPRVVLANGQAATLATAGRAALGGAGALALGGAAYLAFFRKKA
jgi:hypothetical protein